jgi:hypothetical protein
MQSGPYWHPDLFHQGLAPASFRRKHSMMELDPALADATTSLAFSAATTPLEPPVSTLTDACRRL